MCRFPLCGRALLGAVAGGGPPGSPPPPIEFNVADGTSTTARTTPSVLPFQLPWPGRVQVATIEDREGPEVAVGQVSAPAPRLGKNVNPSPRHATRIRAEAPIHPAELKAGANPSARPVSSPPTPRSRRRGTPPFRGRTPRGIHRAEIRPKRPVLRTCTTPSTTSPKEQKRTRTLKSLPPPYDRRQSAWSPTGRAARTPHTAACSTACRKKGHLRDGRRWTSGTAQVGTRQGTRKFMDGQPPGRCWERAPREVGWYGKGKEEVRHRGARAGRSMQCRAANVEFASRLRPVKGPVESGRRPARTRLPLPGRRRGGGQDRERNIFIRPEGEDKPGARRTARPEGPRQTCRGTP